MVSFSAHALFSRALRCFKFIFLSCQSTSNCWPAQTSVLTKKDWRWCMPTAFSSFIRLVFMLVVCTFFRASRWFHAPVCFACWPLNSIFVYFVYFGNLVFTFLLSCLPVVFPCEGATRASHRRRYEQKWEHSKKVDAVVAVAVSGDSLEAKDLLRNTTHTCYRITLRELK